VSVLFRRQPTHHYRSHIVVLCASLLPCHSPWARPCNRYRVSSVYVPRPSWVRRFRPHLHHHNSICTRNGKSVLCVSSLLRITVFSCRPGLPACVLLYVRAPSNCYARLGGHMILFKLISLLPLSSVDRANALPVARFAMWNSHTYRLVLLIVVVSHRFYFRCDPL
jgi:hypothetical protein